MAKSKKVAKKVAKKNKSVARKGQWVSVTTNDGVTVEMPKPSAR